LCKFIRLRSSPSISRESTNRCDSDDPNRTSAEHPPHFHPTPPIPPTSLTDDGGALPFFRASHPHVDIQPRLHAWLIEYVRPALQTAYRKAASLLPIRRKIYFKLTIRRCVIN
jgi:hypothetical protein